MLQLSSEIGEHINLDLSTMCLCWRIKKKNGEYIYGTEHDVDLPIVHPVLGGIYRAGAGITGSDIKSTNDMSVPNMEVRGALRDQFVISDITIADIESGLLDNARVDVFLANWQEPAAGIVIRRSGVLGHFERDSSGIYQNEVLGLSQLLAQNIGRTDGERCNAVFGDARCKKDLAPITRTGTITAIVSRRQFTVELDPGSEVLSETYYNYAKLKLTSGENEDFERETKLVVLDGETAEVELWEEVPADLEIGDTISLPPGCDQSYTTCLEIHDNLLNMRATGIFIPGLMELMKGPGAHESEIDIEDIDIPWD